MVIGISLKIEPQVGTVVACVKVKYLHDCRWPPEAEAYFNVQSILLTPPSPIESMPIYSAVWVFFDTRQ